MNKKTLYIILSIVIIFIIINVALITYVLLTSDDVSEEVDEYERLAEDRDNTRANHLSSLETSLYTYNIDEEKFPPGITEELVEICNTEVGANCIDLIDLSDMGTTIEVDPQGGISNNGTGYFLAIKNHRVYLHAVKAETRIITVGNLLGLEGYGGYIAYVDKVNDPHILIAADEDQASSQVWSNVTNVPVGTETVIGTGQANTTAIITQTDYTDSAAKVCDNLIHNDYTDWFLPSKDELNQMYVNLHNTTFPIGNFADNLYWSSSEYNSNDAWDQCFNTGGQYDGVKTRTLRVRCARLFNNLTI